jgi:hypothetical protein
MAANVYDFKSQGAADGSLPRSTSGTSVQDSNVAAGAIGTITAGDICIYLNGSWAKLATGEGAVAGRYGLAMSTSTDTVGAAGLVKIAYHPSGLIVRGVPTTPGNLAQTILGDIVSVDVAGDVQTIDENAAGVLLVTAYDATSGSESIDVVLPYNTTPA